MEIKVIKSKIHEIRGFKVMLDYDLAKLYEIENRSLKQAVKRNITRFPKDFMFTLVDDEISQLVSQNVIPSKSYFGGSYPFAFTEQGVAVLSSVLKSDKAIEINISIMRTFVTIRKFASEYTELAKKIHEIETQIPDIYNALNFLMDKEKSKESIKERTKIGYKK